MPFYYQALIKQIKKLKELVVTSMIIEMHQQEKQLIDKRNTNNFWIEVELLIS